MDGRERSRFDGRRLSVPAVLAGLVVAVPLAAAAGPSAGWYRSAATAVTTERADQIIQVVTEAVRHLCGSQSAVAPNRPHAARSLASAPARLPHHAPVVVRPPAHAALPQFVALPPPIC